MSLARRIANNKARAATVSAAAGAVRHQSGKIQVQNHGASDCIGVDLGTTFSCVAVMEGDKPRVIENAEGFRTTPSYVAFTKNQEKLVGLTARRQTVTNSQSTFYAIKRLIGRRYDDAHIQDDIKKVPYKIVRNTNGDAWVQDGNGKQYSPSQIGAFVLEKMKETAEAHLGKKVKNAVVTCPAYFNDAQRQATKDAGAIAGLNVLRIINEPTAAALAFGIDKTKDSTIAVYDLGGGTFDVSILDIAGGVFQVKATNGDTHLGGEDYDLCMTDHILKEFKAKSGIDLSTDRMALQRVREAAEKAKCELSSSLQTEVNLPFIKQTADGPQHIEMTITREKWEQLSDHLTKRSLGPMKRCLVDADISLKSEISEVVLVGGMTRMPKVIETVKEFFEREPFRGVNPDEAVAIGAAIQGAVLRGDVKGLILIDVTPLSLGTEVRGGGFTRIIEKNTTVPVKKTHSFTTTEDGQTSVRFDIFQGEREMARDNKKLGGFTLDGIMSAPRGVPQIDVSFELDADGILNASAKDRASGKRMSCVVTTNGGLSQAEIERMQRDAEIHAASDKIRRQMMEAKNKAESNIHTAETQIGGYKYVGDAEKENAKKLAKDLKKILENSNSTKEQIEEASGLLEKAVMECGRIEYQQAAAANGGGSK